MPVLQAEEDRQTRHSGPDHPDLQSQRWLVGFGVVSTDVSAEQSPKEYEEEGRRRLTTTARRRRRGRRPRILVEGMPGNMEGTGAIIAPN